MNFYSLYLVTIYCTILYRHMLDFFETWRVYEVANTGFVLIWYHNHDKNYLLKIYWNYSEEIKKFLACKYMVLLNISIWSGFDYSLYRPYCLFLLFKNSSTKLWTFPKLYTVFHSRIEHTYHSNMITKLHVHSPALIYIKHNTQMTAPDIIPQYEFPNWDYFNMEPQEFRACYLSHRYFITFH